MVLTAFQQADGKTKNRAAIVLRVMRPFGDLLICGVSRQLRHRVPDFDEMIASTDSDFASSGLAAPLPRRPIFHEIARGVEAAAPRADAAGVLDERGGVVVERPAQGDEPRGLLVVMLGAEGK